MDAQEKYLRALKLARDALHFLNQPGTRESIIRSGSFRGISLFKIARVLAGFSPKYGRYFRDLVKTNITVETISTYFDKCYKTTEEFSRLRQTIESKYIPRSLPTHPSIPASFQETDAIDSLVKKAELRAKQMIGGELARDDAIREAQELEAAKEAIVQEEPSEDVRPKEEYVEVDTTEEGTQPDTSTRAPSETLVPDTSLVAIPNVLVEEPAEDKIPVTDQNTEKPSPEAEEDVEKPEVKPEEKPTRLPPFLRFMMRSKQGYDTASRVQGGGNLNDFESVFRYILSKQQQKLERYAAKGLESVVRKVFSRGASPAKSIVTTGVSKAGTVIRSGSSVVKVARVARLVTIVGRVAAVATQSSALLVGGVIAFIVLCLIIILWFGKSLSVYTPYQLAEDLPLESICTVSNMSVYVDKYGFYTPTGSTTRFPKPADHQAAFEQAKGKALLWAGRFGVDPALVVWWIFFETGGKLDSYSYSNCEDNNSNVNYNCPNTASGHWQLGYGIQYGDTLGKLPEAFSTIYGDVNDVAKTKAVGQNVLTKAGQSMIFPDKSLGQMVVEGNVNQYWFSVLMRDPDISAYLLAYILNANLNNPNGLFRDRAFGWSPYYQEVWQETSNLLNDVLLAWGDSPVCSTPDGVPIIIPEDTANVLYWASIINNNLQRALWSYYNRMLATITNGGYTAVKRQGLTQGVDSNGLYWCTNLIIDAYNLAGITGLGPGHQGVVNMEQFWKTTSGYKYLDYRGGNHQAVLQSVHPGQAIFFVDVPGVHTGKEHVAMVSEVSIDVNGNGSIQTIDSNNVVKVIRYPVYNWNIQNTPYQVTGFGAV